MINYIIQVLFFQTIFLAVYDLFLQKETFFNWNRFYLLMTPLISFIIPWVRLERISNDVVNQQLNRLPEVIINPESIFVLSNSNVAHINYFQIVFFVGAIIISIVFIKRLVKIFKLINSSKVVKKEKYNLVILKSKQSAFSFFNYIFINKELFDRNELVIIEHELIHCKQRHTLDLLFFEILKIVMWFNPLVYIYQKRITVLHEFISDAEVVKNSTKETYFNKLLSETFNVENISFINQFYKHSLIKKRITMISKSKSQKVNQLKYLLLVPILLGMLMFSSFSKNNSEIESFSISTNSLEFPEANNLKLDSIKDVSFATIDEVPIFEGCKGSQDELRKCLQEGITKHVASNFNSELGDNLGLNPGISRIFVLFKIDYEGNIIDVKARAAHEKLVEEAIRVVKLIPKMKPGKHKNKFVNVKYSLPIAFKVKGKKSEKTLLDLDNMSTEDKPLFILDGKEITEEEQKNIKPDEIKRIDVLKGEAAIKKYGVKGENGVVEITSKVE
ncbi:M56 family metallopeptidase [Lutibacter citreus]|uniref:M56 family metallopeptidase n=1 Tax=Lutibacter citreus TaxID=2138210 RepID=UPI000DBEA10D|nr:M56 family metallopeptidase [Lutibacter citreus]